MRFSSNYARLLSQFALSVHDHHSVSAVLFGQRFWYVVIDPIPNFVTLLPWCVKTKIHYDGVHRCFCYRQQQAAVVSVISTASREDSSCCSTNLRQLVGGS